MSKKSKVPAWFDLDAPIRRPDLLKCVEKPPDQGWEDLQIESAARRKEIRKTYSPCWPMDLHMQACEWLEENLELPCFLDIERHKTMVEGYLGGIL